MAGCAPSWWVSARQQAELHELGGLAKSAGAVRLGYIRKQPTQVLRAWSLRRL